MTKINNFEARCLERPTGALHSFNDVFSTGDEDFDAALTTQYRHLRPRDTEYGVGGRDLRDSHGVEPVLRAAYGVELVAQLLDGLQAEVKSAISRAEVLGRGLHSNIEDARCFVQSKAVRVIANSAPRSDKKGQNNGTNFYLGILDNGLEVYATPIDALTYVRERIVALFEIPNVDHPLFDGEREQFRSSIIARTCEEPSHLKRIFGNADWPQCIDEILGHLPGFHDIDVPIIPQQDHLLQVAFVDEFGNVRVRARAKGATRKSIQAALKDNSFQIGIGGVEDDRRRRVRLVSSLDDLKEGELGFYENVSDPFDYGKPGYWELNAKWNGTRINTHRERLGSPKIGTPIYIL